MSFSELGLRPELLRAIADSGYDTPTPVQTEAIPIVLAGRDLMAGAQTGTGKTAAFVLPILQRLHASPVELDRRAVRALILVPTRELAIQVEESVQTYGKHAPLRSVAVYGGASLPDQLRELDAGAEIIVATPGRLLDLVWRGSIDFGAVEFLVLDEADRMLDMGFIDDISTIIGLLPPERQSLLFSATFPEAIRRLTKKLLNDPATVQVTPPNSTTTLVDHVVLRVEDSHKRATLSHLMSNGHVTSALVFVRTKHGADRLTNQLARDGIRVGRDPRRSRPVPAHRGARGLQGRSRSRARGDRGGGARHRHRRAAVRRELRPAAIGRGLRPPHRTDGTSRRGRRRHLARVRGRAPLPARHRAAHRRADPGGAGPRLRERTAPARWRPIRSGSPWRDRGRIPLRQPSDEQPAERSRASIGWTAPDAVDLIGPRLVDCSAR